MTSWLSTRLDLNAVYCRVTALKRMATEGGSHMLLLDCITSDEYTKKTHWDLMFVD